MNRRRPLSVTSRLATSASTPAFGISLAFLWAFHAAATHVPGAGYFRLPILFAMATGFLVWRLSLRDVRRRHTTNSGMTVGLSCWFVAATLSTILNWRTDEVALTYIVVFLAGGAIFVGLSGITCTPANLDIAVAGLAAGSLFPLIAGLQAFGGEWGTPDVTTTMVAWQSIARMNTYTEATFGNRGNTAGFLLIIAPIFLAVLLDCRKRLALRAFCAATLILITLNLMIVQVRAAFVALFVAFVVVWAFKLGVRRLPLMVGALVLGWVLLFKFQPDAGLMMTDRILPAITVDTEGDESVRGRADGIKEGVQIAQRNWLLGIGPGAALTIHSLSSAHQFHVQEAMETGVLGFVGALLFSVGVLLSLFRTIVRGRRDQVNDTRFMLLIGPTTFMLYSTIANAALNNSSVNTWTILVASMLALAPRFEPVTGMRRAVLSPRSLLHAPRAISADTGTSSASPLPPLTRLTPSRTGFGQIDRLDF
jgi:O-antigen ligase